jgi:hypothetical protein
VSCELLRLPTAPIKRVKRVLPVAILSFHQWLDGVSKSLERCDFGFHDLNLQNNLRVLRQLQYLQPLDIRHSDLVAQTYSGLKVRTLFIRSTQ